jgi:hypothetical protein
MGGHYMQKIFPAASFSLQNGSYGEQSGRLLSLRDMANSRRHDFPVALFDPVCREKLI